MKSGEDAEDASSAQQLAQLQLEISELRRQLHAMQEEEAKLEAQLTPLREKQARR